MNVDQGPIICERKINNHYVIDNHNETVSRTNSEGSVDSLHNPSPISNRAALDMVFRRRNNRLVSPDDVIDVHPNVERIIEYANESLSSLIDACRPLTDIVHDTLTYAKRVLEETPERPPDRLTVDESGAI